MSKRETRSALATSPTSEVRDATQFGLQPVKGAIGFVGLGHMGKEMASNLAAAGRSMIAYVRRADHIAGLEALGLRPTMDIGDLFDCEVVISMLPDDDAVRDVVFGRQGDDLDSL